MKDKSSKEVSRFTVSPLKQCSFVTRKFRSLDSICYLEYTEPWKTKEFEPHGAKTDTLQTSRQTH